jgi:hypothetical protein
MYSLVRAMVLLSRSAGDNRAKAAAVTTFIVWPSACPIVPRANACDGAMLSINQASAVASEAGALTAVPAAMRQGLLSAKRRPSVSSWIRLDSESLPGPSNAALVKTQIWTIMIYRSIRRFS